MNPNAARLAVRREDLSVRSVRVIMVREKENGRCILPSAPGAAKTLWYPSSPRVTDLYIARNVML
jgi:hypothetical protein